MTKDEIERRRNHPKVRELKGEICDKDSGKFYLFISYKSDDWEKVLTEIAYKLVNEFGLNIYFDSNFDVNNEVWTEQFPENMDCNRCVGVLAFLDDKYATSYATLMELMHSQTYYAGDESGLPIIPVNLGDLTSIEGDLGDEDTGLGVVKFDNNNTNENAPNEKKLFEEDYSDVVELHPDIPSGFKIYKSGKKFKKKICSKMVRSLLAFKGYNINMYSNTEEFYENLVDRIKNTCGDKVFTKAQAPVTTPSPAVQAEPVPKENAAPVPAKSDLESAREKLYETGTRIVMDDASVYTGDAEGGIAHGKGIMEYTNGNVYEGFVKGGFPNGMGIMRYKNGNVYDGEWADGKQNGQGTMIYKDRNAVYDGMWTDGKENGHGIMKYANEEVCEGEWKKGKLIRGKYKYANGNAYDGEWQDDEKNGQGTMEYANGDVYEGTWEDGDISGKGTATLEDGDIICKGEFLNDEIKKFKNAITLPFDPVELQSLKKWLNGQGTIKYVNHDVYEGEFMEGEPWGRGTMKYANGDVYKGEFVGGYLYGQGKYIFTNGDVYEGVLIENGREGYGTLTYAANGEVVTGEWKECEFRGGPNKFLLIVCESGVLYEF